MLQRGVAQGLERLLWEQDVGGSIPLTPIFYLIKRSGLTGICQQEKLAEIRNLFSLNTVRKISAIK